MSEVAIKPEIRTLTPFGVRTKADILGILPEILPNKNERSSHASALQRAWDEIGNILQQGAVIGTNGEIYSIGLEDLDVDDPEELDFELSQKQIITGTTSALRRTYGVDFNQFDNFEDRPGKAALVINEGVADRLFYLWFPSPKNLQVRLDSAHSASAWCLERPFIYLVARAYQDFNVQARISTRLAANAGIQEFARVYPGYPSN